MNSKQHIDKKIKEKLDAFSASPPPHIWNGVAGELAAQKRRKRWAVAGWAAAAAMVLLAFVAGWHFNNNSIKTSPSTAQVLTVQPNNHAESKNNDKVLNVESDNVEPNGNIEITKTPVAQSTTEKYLAAAHHAESAGTPGNPELFPRKKTHLERLARSDFKFDTEPGKIKLQSIKNIATAKPLNAIEKELIAANLRDIDTQKPDETGWKMSMYVSPGYASQVSEHSDGYSREMSGTANNGTGNVEGGFSIQYKTGKRWSVESGVYYAQNGQKADNSLNLMPISSKADMMYAGEERFAANSIQINNGAVAMNSAAGVIAFSGTPKGAEIIGGFENLTSSSNSLITNGDFSQVFNFVEIPLFLRYRVVDQKFGVELLGGMNAGVVVGNNAYIDNEYGVQRVGKTRDISTLNLSGTVGVGMNYALGKHFSLAFEPRLNYYLSSINSNPEVDFRPYRIGFYTGVSYDF